MTSAFRGALALALHGGAFARPNWLFWLDFVLYPPIAAVVAASDWRDAMWPVWAALGFGLFTLAEYWLHRPPLHAWLYHDRHGRHHTHPREYVVFPVYSGTTDEVVLKAVSAILTSFGIEEDDRKELREDLTHLRRWRKSVEQAQTYTFKAVISVIVTGLIGATWLGIKTILAIKGGG